MYSNMRRQNNQYTPTHLIYLYRIGQGDQHNKYCNRRLIPNIRWLTTSTKSKRLIETFLTCYGSWFSCMRIIEHKLNQYDFLVSMSHAFDYSQVKITYIHYPEPKTLVNLSEYISTPHWVKLSALIPVSLRGLA